MRIYGKKDEAEARRGAGFTRGVEGLRLFALLLAQAEIETLRGNSGVFRGTQVGTPCVPWCVPTTVPTSVPQLST